MSSSYSLAHLAQYLGAELVGEADYAVSGIAALSNAGREHISFITGPAYQKYLRSTQAGALIISASMASDFQGNKLIVANPYLSYAKLTQLFDQYPVQREGIHPSAVVDPTAVLAEGITIGPNAVIGAFVSLGADVQIGPGSVVGERAVIGSGTRLAANVTLYHGVIVGRDCIIHSGAVIGADGFGFAREGKTWIKIHQLGTVVIGDSVEIGANTTIDRGALDNTVIADGVKLDNLVQIAHNVHLGRNTAMAAHSGIAGSTHVGDNCTVAGLAGISGHLMIADDVHLTATTLVTSSIDQPGSYSSGTTAAPTREWRKNAVRFRQLESIVARLKNLEKSGKTPEGSS